MRQVAWTVERDKFWWKVLDGVGVIRFGATACQFLSSNPGIIAHALSPPSSDFAT